MKRGIAKGKFRMDSCRKWIIGELLSRPKAANAREHMMKKAAKDGKHSDSVTDDVVRDYMGGFNAASNQEKAYAEIINNIKAGKSTKEATGSLAEAARKRMIERQEQDKHYPDIGQDRANRRAYPAGGNKC